MNLFFKMAQFVSTISYSSARLSSSSACLRNKSASSFISFLKSSAVLLVLHASLFRLLHPLQDANIIPVAAPRRDPTSTAPITFPVLFKLFILFGCIRLSCCLLSIGRELQWLQLLVKCVSQSLHCMQRNLQPRGWSVLLRWYKEDYSWCWFLRLKQIQFNLP